MIIIWHCICDCMRTVERILNWALETGGKMLQLERHEGLPLHGIENRMAKQMKFPEIERVKGPVKLLVLYDMG